MRFFMWWSEESHGECCREIFRVGNRCIIIFGVGGKVVIGSGFTMLCTSWNVSDRGDTKSRVRDVWIRNRSRVWAANRKPEAMMRARRLQADARHLLVDTIGLPIAVKVTAASESDQAGARKLFAEGEGKIKNIRKIWVDGTYRGVDWHAEVKEQYGIELEVKQNEPGVKGFVAVAKRWVVERTFGWLVQSRRLVREYEKLAESTEAMIHLTMIRILVRRLAPDFSD